MAMTEVVSNRRQQTRERLMVAAIEVFAERGIAVASVEEICERAGFTRGAFYSNFDTKEELCLAVLRHRGDAVITAARQAIDTVPETPVAPGTLEGMISEAIGVFGAAHPMDAQWMLVRYELRLHALRNPEVGRALARVEREIDDLVEAAMAVAIRRQGARTVVPLRQLLTLLDTYAERVTLAALLTGGTHDPGRWTDGVAALLRALIVPPEDEQRQTV